MHKREVTRESLLFKLHLDGYRQTNKYMHADGQITFSFNRDSYKKKNCAFTYFNFRTLNTKKIMEQDDFPIGSPCRGL